MRCYLNGNYLSGDEAKISILDIGLLRGFSAFEYLRTYKKRPFHLRDHLSRLHYSSSLLGLELPLSLDEIEKIVLNLIEDATSEMSIKILLTGGSSEDQMNPLPVGNLIIFAYPFTAFSKLYYEIGLSAITTSQVRTCPMSKTTNYISAILALQEGKAKNAQEALFLNSQGEILEATTSNFFAVKGHSLITCTSDEVLLGITQEVVINLAAPHFQIERRSLRFDEISTIEEAFITSSNKEIVPITKINETKIAKGKKTSEIQALFKNYTEQEVWSPLKIERHEKVENKSVEKYLSIRSGKTVTI
jgi:branched-chain amino acid aminotransferase